MSYHGRVTVGGTPDVRELADLIITKVAVGPMDNNAYLLRSRQDDTQVLVDAANDTDTLLQVVGEGGLAAVITTHRHQDHWQSLADVVRRTGAETIAGEYDADELPVEVDRRVAHGDHVMVGACRLEVIHLVGHTPGSVALLYDDPEGTPHLFTGDSLFPGGVGKTRSSEDFASLIDHVETRIFDRLPDETWVYPGHGDDTTLGAERPQLPQWRERGW